MTALAWISPLLAAMAALLLGMGGLTGRISGSVSIGLLVGVPLLVRVLPTEAVELAERVPALGDPVVELLGACLPLVFAGALVPYVVDVRIRVRSGLVAGVGGIAGAGAAVWLSGDALRYLRVVPFAVVPGIPLLGAALMLAATAVTAAVAAAARTRRLVGLVAVGTLLVMWVALPSPRTRSSTCWANPRAFLDMQTSLSTQVWVHRGRAPRAAGCRGRSRAQHQTETSRRPQHPPK